MSLFRCMSTLPGANFRSRGRFRRGQLLHEQKLSLVVFSDVHVDGSAVPGPVVPGPCPDDNACPSDAAARTGGVVRGVHRDGGSETDPRPAARTGPSPGPSGAYDPDDLDGERRSALPFSRCPSAPSCGAPATIAAPPPPCARTTAPQPAFPRESADAPSGASSAACVHPPPDRWETYAEPTLPRSGCDPCRGPCTRLWRLVVGPWSWIALEFKSEFKMAGLNICRN